MVDTTYATLSFFKQYNSITDTNEDPLLQKALNAAAEAIDRYLGRTFEDVGTPVARTFAPKQTAVLDVDDFSTITGLIIQTDDNGDGVYETTWATGEYQLEPTTGRYAGIGTYPFNAIRGITRWFTPDPYGRAVVQVTARWGWATVPASVEMVCYELAKDIWKAKDTIGGVVGFGEFGAIRLGQSPALRARLVGFSQNLGIV